MTGAGLGWLLEEVEAVILYAIDGEAERIFESLQRISNEGGAAAMFSACFAWATAAAHMSGMVETVGEMDADGVALVPLDGQPIDDHAPGTFAVRFFACALNDDTATAHALFDATLTDVNYHRSCVAALIGMVAQIGRIKQAERSGES